MTIIQEPGQVIAGRYRLERPLARGGMGSVWVAHHLQLDVEIAVKFMTPEVSAAASANMRFEREAKAAAKLKNTHIVQVTDYGSEGDTLYLVMELLRGEDLGSRIKRVGRLPLPAVAAILGQACKGLTQAHEAGIVHRDLKPANLFLARDGEDEVTKILDFGIAKAPVTPGSGAETRTGALIGSPNYMSPEQITDSKSVDWRSDIWSLGVIVYQCLTGQDAFPGTEVGQILVSVCSGPIPVPSRVVPELGPEVDRFMAVALARPKEQRFQRAGDFARALFALAGYEGRISMTGATPGQLGGPVSYPSSPYTPVSFGGTPAPMSGSPAAQGATSGSYGGHSGSLGAAPPPAGTPYPLPPSGMGSTQVASTPNSVDPATGMTGSSSGAARARRKAPLGPLLAIGVVVVGLAALALARPLFSAKGRSAPPEPPLATSVDPSKASAVEVVPAAVTASPPPSTSQAPQGPPVALTSVPAIVTARSPSLTKPTGSAKPPPPKTKAGCDPNYTVDSDGRKHFKPECF